eukprot:GHVS01107158.1.p1 GENE.GHVS01107158.1~~GHVS01107158.1.p1  ORF type:complete len:598 (+),score=72.00 GHVS01107158.1:170-1795(+)
MAISRFKTSFSPSSATVGGWWEYEELSRVELSLNRLGSFPDDPEILTAWPSVASFCINGNNLVILPESLFLLPKLKTLRASSNRIATLPGNLLDAPSLVDLDLSKNELSNLTAFEKLSPSLSPPLLASLHCLGLAHNRLSSLPDALCRLSSLRHLDVSNNQLTALPLSFVFLAHLTYLNLSDNFLTELPRSLGGGGLESLRASGESGFRELVRLEASRNRLIKMSSMLQTPSLVDINVSHNQIEYLHKDLFWSCCSSLTSINLSNNKLTQLAFLDCEPLAALGPDNMPLEKLRCLKLLDVSFNDLLDLPEQLGFIKSLSKVCAEGNPIRAIKQPLLRKNQTEQLLRFLRNRTEEPNIDSKPVVKGEGSSLPAYPSIPHASSLTASNVGEGGGCRVVSGDMLGGRDILEGGEDDGCVAQGRDILEGGEDDGCVAQGRDGEERRSVDPGQRNETQKDTEKKTSVARSNGTMGSEGDSSSHDNQEVVSLYEKLAVQLKEAQNVVENPVGMSSSQIRAVRISVEKYRQQMKALEAKNSGLIIPAK